MHGKMGGDRQMYGKMQMDGDRQMYGKMGGDRQMYGKMGGDMMREDASSDDAGAPESRQLQMEGGRQSRGTSYSINDTALPPQKRGATPKERCTGR